MKALSFCLFFCVAYLVSVQAHALRMSPFKTEIVPVYDNGTQVFRIENNHAEATAVQVGVYTWDMNEAGEEKNERVEDLFVVFPAQIVLEPHEAKSVRVQWVGDTDIKHEIPFRLLVEEMPVVLKSTVRSKAAVKFMVRFLAGLYVTPERGSSKVEVVKVEKKGDGLRVHLTNQGVKHSIIKEPEITLFSEGGQKVRLVGELLKKIEGENIHAGKNRYFDIAMPGGVSGNIVRGEIKYKQGF